MHLAAFAPGAKILEFAPLASKNSFQLCLLHMISLAPLMMAGALAGALAGKGPIITTDDGPIQGTYDPLTSVTTYHAIPFASPPLANLRWKKPVRPTPWTKPVSRVSSCLSSVSSP